MKVFSQLYVGMHTVLTGIPLGFATPYEENAAGRKRQETVNKWLGEYSYDYLNSVRVKNKVNTKIIENTPAPGFKITDDVKRVYWGGGNVVWRVEDPRGFELEIQSNNLMAMIQSCGIEEGGLIPGNCVWGRSGGDNILLHETSDEYKDAVKAAETLKAPKQVGKASRQIGALYRRVDGSLGIYLGKVHMTDTYYKEVHQRTSRVTLPGGQQLLANTTTHEINPSVEFEAVLSVTPGPNDTVLPTQALKLYKKAPLVDEMPVMVQLPEIDNAFLLTLDWEFASSSISVQRIVALTMNPIPNPEACLVKLPEHLFKKKIDDMTMYVKNNGTYRPPAHRLLSWKEDEAVVINDMLCDSIVMIGDEYNRQNDKQTEPSYHIALPAVLNGSMITTSTIQNQHNNPLIPNTSPWAAYQKVRVDAALNAACAIDFVKLPTFKDGAELLKYTQDLYDNCAMFYVTARESTK
jgi:hypothetical protein